MKRIQVIFLVSVVIALISLAIPVYLMFWGPEHIELAGKTAGEIFSDENWVPIVVIPLTVVIVIASLIPFYRILFPQQVKNGELAKAVVLKVWDTGTTINDNPQIGLLLEAKTREGVSFQAETKTVVSRLHAALVQPGISAEILYDPQNTKKIQIIEIDLSSAGNGDIESRLTQLLDLRNKGLITEEEYQKKRGDIVKSI
jgi:uncharacterized membrane protein